MRNCPAFWSTFTWLGIFTSWNFPSWSFLRTYGYYIQILRTFLDWLRHIAIFCSKVLTHKYLSWPSSSARGTLSVGAGLVESAFPSTTKTFWGIPSSWSTWSASRAPSFSVKLGSWRSCRDHTFWRSSFPFYCGRTPWAWALSGCWLS